MMITAGFTAIVFRSRRLDVVIPPMSLRQFLLAAADRGDQPAVIDGLTGRVTSYGQFAAWWIGSPRGWPHMIWQVITRRSSARGARPSGSATATCPACTPPPPPTTRSWRPPSRVSPDSTRRQRSCAPTVSHAYCCDAGRGRFLSTMEEHR